MRETNEVPELANINEIEERDILDVYLGVKELAITSDGETFENPKAYNSHLKKLQRYQRMVSRRVKGSQNKKKAITRLAKVDNIFGESQAKDYCYGEAKTKEYVQES